MAQGNRAHGCRGTMLIAWHAPCAGWQVDHPLFPWQRGECRQSRPSNRTDQREWFRRSLPEQRGYGGSGGRPTEEDNVADAIAAYDYLIGLGVPAASIVAYGESLGSTDLSSGAARANGMGSAM